MVRDLTTCRHHHHTTKSGFTWAAILSQRELHRTRYTPTATVTQGGDPTPLTCARGPRPEPKTPGGGGGTGGLISGSGGVARQPRARVCADGAEEEVAAVHFRVRLRRVFVRGFARQGWGWRLVGRKVSCVTRARLIRCAILPRFPCSVAHLSVQSKDRFFLGTLGIIPLVPFVPCIPLDGCADGSESAAAPAGR